MNDLKTIQYKLDCLASKLATSGSQLAVVSLKNLEGVHKRRIFNDGRSVGGSGIGKYSKNYIPVRKDKGRQTAYVDLSFNKDMQRSMIVLSSVNGAVYGFQNDFQRLKAEGNEKRFGKNIFGLQSKERDAVKKSQLIELRLIIKKCLGGN